jgi:cytochrome c oxidase assembly factor CtaG
MTQSSFTRLLVRVQIGSLVAFILAAAVAVFVMLPYFADGAVVQRDGAYVDRTGAVRTAEDFERYSVREGIARYAGVCGLASATASMLAGFCLRSR